MSRILVTVSGGRTSAYMAIKLHRENPSKYFFAFANTGQEHEKTLIFVNNLQKYFKLPIIWVEAKVHHDERKASTYKVVTFKTASRKGEPFEQVIKKYGLPNQNFLHCTRELKINPITALMADLSCTTRCLGIRYDELHRYKPKPNVRFPMVEDFQTTKKQVLKFWKKQKFDLDLDEHLGNCVTCYKKSDNKLLKVLDDSKEHFNFFLKMEKKYPDEKRNMFRGQRTTQDVINGVLSTNGSCDTCAEECGSYIPDDENLLKGLTNEKK